MFSSLTRQDYNSARAAYLRLAENRKDDPYSSYCAYLLAIHDGDDELGILQPHTLHSVLTSISQE